jgi:prepilin-type processing-associated H-X9-DG protein
MPAGPKFSLSTSTQNNWTQWGGYAINAAHYRYWGSLPHKPPVSNLTAYGMYVQKASAIETPANTVWVMDSAEGANAGGTPWSSQIGYAMLTVDSSTPTVGTSSTPPTIGPTSSLAPWQGGYASARHLDTINVLYCDGHVKASKVEALVPGGSDKFFTVQDD